MRSNPFFVSLAITLLAAGCGGSSSGSAQGPFGNTAAGVGSGTTSSVVTPGTTAPPASTAPTTPPATNPPNGPVYIVSGWLPYWAYATGDPILDANTGNGLDEVNLFGIGLRPDGTLSKRTGIEDPARIARIRSRGGEVIPTIYDVGDSTALESVLANPTYRATAIREMLALLDQGNYDGIDLDFEHAKSSNRDAFSRFVADLGREVKARGKVYSVTIPGKRQDLPSWAGYDYAALGAAADRIKIMTYGYSGSWSNYPGGPIAPTDWIRRVLDYAITVIPANKIQLGIPFYGYDWDENGGTRSRTYRVATNDLIQRASASPVVYEPTRGEAHFTYVEGGVTHTVWFSEERSVAAKAALVKVYGLRGLSIWALGYGARPLWDAIRTELKAP